MTRRVKFGLVALLGIIALASAGLLRSTQAKQVDLDTSQSLLRFSQVGGYRAVFGLPDQDGDGFTDFAVRSQADVGIDWGESIQDFRRVPEYELDQWALFSSVSGKQLKQWNGQRDESLQFQRKEHGFCVHAEKDGYSSCLGPEVCEPIYGPVQSRSRSQGAFDPKPVCFDEQGIMLTLEGTLIGEWLSERLGSRAGSRLTRCHLQLQSDPFDRNGSLILAKAAYYSTSVGNQGHLFELARDGKFTGVHLAAFPDAKGVGSMALQEIAVAEANGRYLAARALMDDTAPYAVSLYTQVPGEPMQAQPLKLELDDYGIRETLRAMAASGCGTWGIGSTSVELVSIPDQDRDGVEDWQFFVDVGGGDGAALAMGQLSGATGRILPR